MLQQQKGLQLRHPQKANQLQDQGPHQQKMSKFHHQQKAGQLWHHHIQNPSQHQSIIMPGRIMFPLNITAEENEEFFLPRYVNRKKKLIKVLIQ